MRSCGRAVLCIAADAFHLVVVAARTRRLVSAGGGVRRGTDRPSLDCRTDADPANAAGRRPPADSSASAATRRGRQTQASRTRGGAEPSSARSAIIAAAAASPTAIPSCFGLAVEHAGERRRDARHPARLRSREIVARAPHAPPRPQRLPRKRWAARHRAEVRVEVPVIAFTASNTANCVIAAKRACVNGV